MTLEEVQDRHRELMAELLKLTAGDRSAASPVRRAELLRELDELNRRELAMTRNPGYFCGSNYCDDPACQQDHRESL